LIHAHAADDQGNLYIEDPTTDLLVIGASHRVIATAEVRVRSLPLVTVPSFQVDLAVETRGGAWPTGCVDAYPHDEAALLAYLTEAEAERGRVWIESVLEGRMTVPPWLQRGCRVTSTADRLVWQMAMEIADGAVVATGVASPLAVLAIAVARATHAPGLTYLSCVGSLNPLVTHLHRSSEDLAYLDGRTAEISIPDLFDHARRGRVDTVFFGAVEVDAEGRTNLTASGSLASPAVKFPGVVGACSLRRWCKRPILVVPRQSRRCLVPRVGVRSTEDDGRRTRLLTRGRDRGHHRRQRWRRAADRAARATRWCAGDRGDVEHRQGQCDLQRRRPRGGHLAEPRLRPRRPQADRRRRRERRGRDRRERDVRAALKAMAPGGRVVVVGNLESGTIELDPGLLIVKELEIIGAYATTQAELETALLLTSQGRLTPFVTEILPLHAAASAHFRLENREVAGRLVLSPDLA
jgi:acyl CoA:acetate/3-ketoacid CoA transferase beta subunit